jgi:predicted transposase/invertase (TIGR01784 family)
MSKNTSNAEDKLFKITFSRPELVRELLLRTATPAFLGALQLDSLALTNASFVDEQLKEHFADLVFSCRTTAGDEVIVSLLLEHKSYLPQYPPFQIFRYQMNGWQQQMNAKQKPATIIPIIFYHGKERWKALPWQGYLQGMCPAFEPFTLDGGYLLIDLADLSDEEIARFRYGFLKTVLLLMKHRNERQYLLDNLTYILNFVEEEMEIDIQTDDFRIIFRYMTISLPINWADMKQLVKPLFKTHSTMTIIEELEQEIREEALKEGLKQGLERGLEQGLVKGLEQGLVKGLEKGLEQGLEQGLEKGYAQKTRETVISMLENFPDQPVEKIAKVAKVTVAYVLEIKATLSNAKLAEKRKKKN